MCSVVVKDDAYGHGVERIVRAACEAGAEWFGAIDPTSAVRAKAAAGDDARVFSWLTTTRAVAAILLRAGVKLGVGDVAMSSASRQRHARQVCRHPCT